MISGSASAVVRVVAESCTRRIGNDFAIEVHIRVDGQITVSRAHELTKEIESKLRLKFGPATHIVLHVEPIKEKKDE